MSTEISLEKIDTSYWKKKDQEWVAQREAQWPAIERMVGAERRKSAQRDQPPAVAGRTGHRSCRHCPACLYRRHHWPVAVDTGKLDDAAAELKAVKVVV